VHSRPDRRICSLGANRVRAFDWYQNHRPWMTLKFENALCCRKDASFLEPTANLNKDRPIGYLQWQKCRRWLWT